MAFSYLCITYHTVMRVAFSILILSLMALRLSAQRTILVLDVETRTPVPRASVEPDGHAPTLTDSVGMARLPERFDSLTVSHLGYERERLAFSEVRDTVYLFATGHMLGEVVVYSQNNMMESLKKDMSKMVLPDPGQAALRVNIADVLRFFGWKSKRERKKKKVEKIIKELDAKPLEEEE